jgi:Fur family zinc uptake transcriptional regulator
MGRHYSGLSFDTVYRNLRLLHELNVLEQFVFEDGVKFRVRCREEVHHHHLICLDCEKTVPIKYCPMEKLPEMVGDFQIVRHKFEIYGYCSACRQP